MEVASAEEAASTAKENWAKHVLATALGEAGEPPLTPAEARALATKAQDELATLKETLAGLDELGKERARHLSYKTDAVRRNAEEVIKTDDGVKQLVRRFNDLYQEFYTARAAIVYLDAHRMLPAEPRRERNIPLDSPGAEPWRAALVALESDPDAELPT